MLKLKERTTPIVELTKRARIHYGVSQQTIIKLETINILNDIEMMILRGKARETDEHIDGPWIEIFDNQEDCADEVSLIFRNRKIVNVMVTAQTQSGKTGTMTAFIRNYLKDPRNILPTNNIYIITALSSVEWIEQTKSRIPDTLHKRVFHRDNLTNKFAEDIKGKKNVLVIIDEIQIAAKENQTLYKAFQAAGFYNKQNLLKNDIKIVEFTATPDGTIYDLMKWGENAHKIQMYPGDGYTSCKDLLDQNRVFQYKDLCCYTRVKTKVKTSDGTIKAGYKLICNERKLKENFNHLKGVIYSYDEPLYHIIRTPVGNKANITINNFKRFFGDINYHTYDKESDVTDINIILSKAPKVHTFIFLKEKLRCAKTLKKDFIGVAYERYTKRRADDAVITQGLIGRLTGYDDNGKSICFTNIESIVKYHHLWVSEFEDTSVDWYSKTTKKRRGHGIRSKGTYNDPSHIDGMMSASYDEESEEIEPVVMKFNTYEEARNFVKNILGNKRGPMNPKKYINDDGFYECKVRSVRKVWSVEEMYNERRCNIKNGAGYGFRYCYRDVTDKDTLEFWIIYYPDDMELSK
tara:strand:+ start:206 stop:1939 length:1734 start_codon:yes stop_codon:yes gene_type:complete